MVPLRLFALCGALVLCGLFTAAAASAATTRFAAPAGDVMATNDCTAATAPCSLARALAAAASADTISLGAGSYDLAGVALPTVPLAWHATDPDPDKRPVLTSAAAAPTIDVTPARSGSSFSGLEIDNTNADAGSAFPAVKVEPSAAVTITASAITGRSCVAAPDAAGVTIERSTLSTSGSGTCADLPRQSTLRSSRVDRSLMLLPEDPPPVVVTRGLVEDSDILAGLNLAGPDAVARRVRAVGGAGIKGQGLVVDSLARGLSHDEGGIVASVPRGGTLRVVGSTAIGTNGPGLLADGSFGPDDGTVKPNDLVATDTIARGRAADIAVPLLLACSFDSDCEPGLIHIDHSDFITREPAGPGRRGVDPITLGDGNVRTDPLFADATHFDYHLLPGSPAIDAGTPLDATQPTDLDGAARVQGDAPDIGAYETAPPPPPPVADPPPADDPVVEPVGPSGGPAGPATGDGVPPLHPFVSALKFSPARFRVGRGTQISFALTQPADVTFTFERLVKGHAKGARCSTTAKRGKACTVRRAAGHLTITGAHTGTTRVRFTGRLGKKPLAPGTYHVNARPTGGTTSPALRLTVIGAKKS